MQQVAIKVCRKPYAHDVIDEIVRKPKYNPKTHKHTVTYKTHSYILMNTSVGYIIWVEDFFFVGHK